MSAGTDRAILFLYCILTRFHIEEKSHSSKIVCSLFNQEQIAFCVLRQWYIKRWTTEQKVDCFLVISLVQYNNIRCFILSCQLELFDKVVKPILLYCYELWRLSNCDIIERVYLKYCKFLLNLKSSTPNCMIYGDLGR
jgi:hypothetical protein